MAQFLDWAAPVFTRLGLTPSIVQSTGVIDGLYSELNSWQACRWNVALRAGLWTFDPRPSLLPSTFASRADFSRLFRYTTYGLFVPEQTLTTSLSAIFGMPDALQLSQSLVKTRASMLRFGTAGVVTGLGFSVVAWSGVTSVMPLYSSAITLMGAGSVGLMVNSCARQLAHIDERISALAPNTRAAVNTEVNRFLVRQLPGILGRSAFRASPFVALGGLGALGTLYMSKRGGDDATQ